jgi:hypothetical protein
MAGTAAVAVGRKALKDPSARTCSPPSYSAPIFWSGAWLKETVCLQPV